jgi:2-amino-4-hydroxy-6-hydroxymethyldihydropteridine diphosphokinase
MEYTLLLGSNLGDRLGFLNKALSFLETSCGVVLCKSLVYETTSWGFDAPSFLNQAVVIRSTLEPLEFLQRTQQIEKSLGRGKKTSGNGYASREMDIDILFVDNLIISTENLIVPHPRLTERRFVLVPLAEIAPDKVHPVLNKTVLMLFGSCPDSSEVRPFFG